MSDQPMRPRPGDRAERWITVETERLAARAAGDDRIPVALSSETPVSMAYGREILLHTREAVDMRHAVLGLAFLADHDNTRQLGIIEDVHLGADRKLRGMLRKGNHPDAEWMFRDIEAGIRPNLSIGYRIDDVEPDHAERDLYRVTRWTPLEGSTVSVPADITVGIGRSADPSTTRGSNMSTTEEPSHKPGAQAASLADREREITDIVNLARAHDMTDHVGDWIKRGLNSDQVKGEILSRKRDTAPPMTAPGYMDLSTRDAREYGEGYGRMLISVADRRGLTGIVGEVSDQIAKRLNRPTAGLYVPLDLSTSTRASVTGNVVGTSSLGGAGVQTTLMPLIEILRNKMLVRQLGATVLSGLTGNVSFPRHIVPNTLAWEGENPSTPHAHTAATFDNVTLSPKSAMASSAYSRQFLVQSSFDASAFLQNDLASVCAVGLDLAAIDGTGSNNQPTGIMRTSNVGTATFTGTNGGIPTWAELVAFETTVENANGDIGTMGWITTPGLKGKLKATLKNTVAGSAYIWSDANEINGYPAYATKQMPSNFTAGTSTTVAHGVLFGTWSECLIGEFGGAIELIVDPYTNASQAMVNCTALMMVDVGVRHPAAFVANKTALIA